MKPVDFTLRWMNKGLTHNYNVLSMVWVRINVSRRLRFTGQLLTAIIPPHYDRRIQIIDADGKSTLV